MIEDRLRDLLEGQYQTAGEPESRLPAVTRSGRRRSVVRRAAVGAVGVAAVLLLVVGAGWLLKPDPAMAASPFSGRELSVINGTPLILQGELGPQPPVAPLGTDLTFEPVEEPTANDLAAIEEITLIEGYTDPVVVALGRIDAFDTNVYALHQVDPNDGTGQSQVIAIGPDYPSFVAVGGPYESDRLGWGPSSSRGLDGDGFAFHRIPNDQTGQYAQLVVDGEVFWQRPSDGFIWIPFQADPDSSITLTLHDPNTGETLLEHPPGG